MPLINLEVMSLDELHQETLEAGKRHASSEYHLIRCLAAVERRELHRKLGCSTAVQYGMRFLELDSHKAAEMLRVGRVLKERRLLERAYRERRLSWSKVRELTRVMTAETEEFLVNFALEHNAGQVEALVAMSPARWKKSQRQAEPAAGPGLPAQATLDLESVQVPVESERAVAAVAPGPRPAAAAALLSTGGTGAPAQTPPPAHPTPAPAPPLAAPEAFVPLILFKRYLKPDQLALVEQAENRVRARLGGRPSQAGVLEEMAKIVLSTGDSRTKVRYQVYLHVDGITGQGWLDTDRGMLPAPPEVVQEALRQGQVDLVTSQRVAASNWRMLRTAVSPRPAEEATAAAPPEPQSPTPAGVEHIETSTWKSAPPPEDPDGAVAPAPPIPESPKPRGRNRPAIPAGTLRQLFARARGRCEDCRRKVPLDSDHLDFYSENPTHDPERMRLRCKACHSLRHAPDFASRPGWARGREHAMRSRNPADST